MPDVVIGVARAASETLYFQIRDSAALVWNGSSFETYDPLRWTQYDIAMTQQGASAVHSGVIPAALAEGQYSAITFKQLGGSPIEGDPAAGADDFWWDGSAIVSIPDILTHGDANWSTLAVALIAPEILSTPANTIATNASGEVTVENTTAIGTAVWATSTRTLSNFGTLVADIATAVWGEATRTLSNFGTLVTDVRDSVWAATTRTLSAFGFTVTAADVAAIKTVTDKLDDMTEVDGPVSKFTANALEEVPDVGDATAASQATIIADIAALNDPTAAAIATVILDATIDGTLDVKTALKNTFSALGGKVVRTGTDPQALDFYDFAGTGVLFTLTIPDAGATRDRT